MLVNRSSQEDSTGSGEEEFPEDAIDEGSEGLETSHQEPETRKRKNAEKTPSAGWASVLFLSVALVAYVMAVSDFDPISYSRKLSAWLIH